MVVLALTAIAFFLALPFLLLFCVRRIHTFPYLARARPTDITLGTTVKYLHLPLLQARLEQHEERFHATIFGRSGSGKSKLLQSLFLQHTGRGSGVGILEPHHDLSFDCLTSLVASGFYNRPDAYERVIYIDWGNGAYVPFNVLATEGHPDTVAKNVLSAMLRVWPELETAPAFQTLFDAGVKCLIANQLPITALYQLLVDRPFRERCLSQVTDGIVHQAFLHFDSLGRDQPALMGSTLRRAYLLSSNHLARNTLGQTENALDFREIMDAGKAFIINLGNIGDQETTRLLGALLLVQIEQAAKSRTDISPGKRVPCTLLVDEWPAFAAHSQDSIKEILSQCRKYNLFLYLAAQSLAQVDSKRLVGALENCKLQVSFGLGRDSAETQAKHIGIIDPLAIKEEQFYETQHNAFQSFPEQWELWTQELQNLKPRSAWVKLEGKHAVKVRTPRVTTPQVDPEKLDEVLRTYKALYQVTEDQVTKPEAMSPKPEKLAYQQLFDESML